jgi:osmotically-inducible protein OsmY
MVPSAALLIPPAGEHGESARATPPPEQSREDLRLAERIEHALRATGYGPLRGIAVTVHAHLVILGGGVPSYYMKQVAQAAALSLPGASQVRNDLEVGRTCPE